MKAFILNDPLFSKKEKKKFGVFQKHSLLVAVSAEANTSVGASQERMQKKEEEGERKKSLGSISSAKAIRGAQKEAFPQIKYDFHLYVMLH